MNEGESLGASNQKEMNDKAMGTLKEKTESNISELEKEISTATDGPEKRELEVKKATMKSLLLDINASYETYSDYGGKIKVTKDLLVGEKNGGELTKRIR